MDTEAIRKESHRWTVQGKGQALTRDGGRGAGLSVTQAGRDLETSLLPNAAVWTSIV
jgi:hypothetical protein